MGKRRHAFFGALWAVSALLAGCKNDDRAGSPGSASGPVGVSSSSLRQSKVPSSPAEKLAPTAPPTQPPEASEPEPLPTELTEKWQLGQVSDVGPAAPMTATAAGIILISKSNEVHLAKRRGTEFSPVEGDRSDFSRFGRGPAVTEDFVYWVSPGGALLSAPRKGGSSRELDSDARFGARVSALRASDRELVAYIKGSEETTYAHLWAGGYRGGPDERVRLSPEGSSATSVSLVPGSPHPRAIILEGRSGMSPIHVRTVRVTHRRITLELDHVVWVGPGSHSLTELISLGGPGGEATAFVASARDITHFGLAQLPIAQGTAKESQPIWHPYPNGLDPAPVAAEQLCGESHALFAIPSHQRPRAPQELRIARVTAGGLKDEEVVARSRAFNDISVASLPKGAVLSWTADRRTWALVLGCPK